MFTVWNVKVYVWRSVMCKTFQFIHVYEGFGPYLQLYVYKNIGYI